MGEHSRVLFLLYVIFSPADCGQKDRYCAYSPQPMNKDGVEGSFIQEYPLGKDEYIMPDNKTMRCPSEDSPCFSFWGVDLPGDSESYLVQGCWHVKSSGCRVGSACVSTWGPSTVSIKDTRLSLQRQHMLNSTHFCCCYGDMCNVNMSSNLTLAKEDPFREPYDEVLESLSKDYRIRTIAASLTSVFITALMIFIVCCIYMKKCRQNEAPYPDVPNSSDMYLVKSPSTLEFDLDGLKLESVINKGRYGEVWKGTLSSIDVAIKVFTATQRSYYINERDIYLMPFMEHDTLLTFYGAEERLTVEASVQYVLVMSYVPLGTLTSYLKNNLLDWSILCKMSYSITRGLAYLHSEIIVGDQVKSSVAHRDLNSRNVLVNSDLSCCICDFGFAMRIKRCHFLRNGAEENVEQATLTDVGTLLYMAPEVLEGAVNLRDCESSLKQIDVYALGLVLWELASRCSDLYQGMPVPEYKLPYQAEIGVRPTFEEMQLLVTKNKARPAFPDVWKDTNQPVRALKETIEDCWDQDGEARLTALCVEERVLDMMNLWDYRLNRARPIPMTSALDKLESRMDVQHNLTQSSQHIEGVRGPLDSHCGNWNHAADMAQMSEPVNELSDAVSRRSQRVSYTDNSISAASTVETTISPSELDDPIIPGKADCNVLYAQSKSALQPHQGQNPTVERNTHKRSDEDVTVAGNQLVKGNLASGNTHRESPGRSRVLSGNLSDEGYDNQESLLVQNDLLSRNQRHQTLPTPHNSISYLQNQVNCGHPSSVSEPMIVRPKQPNVPGNGFHRNSGYAVAPSNLTNQNAGQKAMNFFGMFRKSKAEKDSCNENPNLKSSLTDKDSAKLYFPFFGKNASNSATSQSPASSSSSHSSRGSLNVIQRPTEVRLLNGLPVVRPTSLPIHSSGSSVSSGSHSEEQSNVISAVPNGTVYNLIYQGLLHGDPPSQAHDDCKNLTEVKVEQLMLSNHDSKNLSNAPNIQLSDLESNGRARRPQSLSTGSARYSDESSMATGSNSNLASPTFL